MQTSWTAPTPFSRRDAPNRGRPRRRLKRCRGWEEAHSRRRTSSGRVGMLAKLVSKYQAQGLAIVAPTQRYGYIVAGTSVPADEELRHIVSVRDTYYGFLADLPVPVSEANHQRYGVSSTPTLVMVDRQGIV